MANRARSSKSAAMRAQAIPDEEPVDPGFDEATYLRAFPDIAEAVRRSTLASGLAHFRMAGQAEGRLLKPEYLALREVRAGSVPPLVSIDALTISHSGATLMTGWSDDRFDRLSEISLETSAEVHHTWKAFPRLVRADVQRRLDTSAAYRFGFLLVAAAQGAVPPPMTGGHGTNATVFTFSSGTETEIRRGPAVTSDADLRDLALATLPTAAAGEQDPEVIHGILDQHIGVQIAAINRMIADHAMSRRLIERVGPSRGRHRGTVITTLRGGADQIVPRLALIASGPGAGEYEFIHIITDKDQFEPALRAAQVAVKTLGVSQTLVLQPEGDPAGPGGDAADIARSDRLIFMDQTVFPRDPDWAVRHTSVLDSAPAAQSRLFGGMLYHADGSLSDGGYYFDQEPALLAPAGEVPRRITATRLRRITHPAPSAARWLREPRSAAGVTGAFLSIDRAWFEQLGGFTRHYARAVYDDIDLCLRSRKAGTSAWVHALPMWHFERRGPPRPEPSRGGIILNDWLLHRQWDPAIVPDLIDAPPFLTAAET